MKTRRFFALTAPIMRAVRWFQIRSVEIQIHGMNEALACIGDPVLCGRIQIARHIARAELVRLRGEYIALLPPGQRRIWSHA